MNKFGDHLMLGIYGTVMTRDTERLIKESGCRGVILFPRNYENPKQLTKLNADLNDAAGKGLIIAVDQEGGRVARLGKPFTGIPPMYEVGQMPDAEAKAREIGTTLGRELREVGINMDFAPVLDVATNAFNPVIGDRSFSSDAKTVAKLGAAFIEGIESQGVMACGKHFPGHGDTDVDSHLGLPLLFHTRKRFDACEFVPFKRAVLAGVSAIMTAHMMIPNLDPLFPATISRIITRDILRGEIGFGGLIFTDDLTMRGIADTYSPARSAILAIGAGADLALICHDSWRYIEALAKLDPAFGGL